MKKVIIFFLVIVFLIIVLIGAAPANWVLYQAQKAVPSLKVSGVSGSAWAGEMTDVQFNSRGYEVKLGTVNWQLAWPSVLTLKPCVSFSTTLPEQTSRGQVCVDPSQQQLTVNDTYATIPASLISNLMGVQIRGEFDGVIDSLSLSQQKLTELNMDVTWKRAAFNNSEVWLDLGELLITINDDQQGGVVAQWSDNKVNGESGPLAVDLTTKLSASQAIGVLGYLEPRPSANRAIYQTLDLIAQRDRSNRYQLDLEL